MPCGEEDDKRFQIQEDPEKNMIDLMQTSTIRQKHQQHKRQIIFTARNGAKRFEYLQKHGEEDDGDGGRDEKLLAADAIGKRES